MAGPWSVAVMVRARDWALDEVAAVERGGDRGDDSLCGLDGARVREGNVPR